MFDSLWYSLPILAQDAAILVGLLAPLAMTGGVVLWGFQIRPLLLGLMRRHATICAVFVLLIAVSVGIGTGLIAQERGLREGSARAASKFDLVIAAPGSEITAMLAAVYLQPSALPLLDGETYARIEAHELVDFAAPIAFGDSWNGAPVVGTTDAFVQHLTGGLSEGRSFATPSEAIAGARVPLQVGQTFAPIHGDGSDSAADAHAFDYTVVGKMPLTGSPWDNAILVPVESVWQVHGLADGHAPGWDGTLGGPFDAANFPGTPAVLVRANALWENYALQSEFTSDRTMAFFPGNVLAQLHALMGDIRQVMSVLAITTQVLVAAGVLTGLSMLTRLLARRLALLRALGAPRRFVFALTWSFATSLILAGSGLGLALGVVATKVISAAITARTDILVTTNLGWPELHLVAAFVSIVAFLSLVPAYIATQRPVTDDLRL